MKKIEENEKIQRTNTKLKKSKKLKKYFFDIFLIISYNKMKKIEKNENFRKKIQK